MSNKERYESFDVTKVKEINKKANPIYLFFKRIIDIVASFLGLAVSELTKSVPFHAAPPISNYRYNN